MSFAGESDILITAESGWFACPFCKKKLQRFTADTEAKHLPIWCPRCRREVTVEIRRDRSA